MWTFLLAPAFAGALAAVHVGTVDGDGIRWESTVTGDGWIEDPATHTPLRVTGSRHVTTHQDDRDGLRPPLVPDAWQRVDLVGLEFTPDAALGLERRVDAWAPPALDAATQARLEFVDPHLGFSTFVDGTTPTLPGRVDAAGQVSATSSIGVGVLFLAVVAGLVAARRLLVPHVRREEVDDYVRKELGR